MSFRVGQGFDIHRLVADRPFVLGGLTIPFEKGPLGHSDGDVVLHALTDALLGAAGLGDIGEWFPPSDPKWKDANSADLLIHVWKAVTQAGWSLVNADMTVLLEAPKLAAYKAPMKAKIAALLGIPENKLALKAKTMEQLGPIGEGQALAAMVTVLLEQV